MPKVFISWSGEKSHAIAVTLHRWLPVVLQTIKPFISSEDLRKGGRWLTELSGELEKESFGIVCLTPSNLTAPWILFESGALSKSVGDSQVAPFLVGVKPSELPQPLTQFNAVLAEKGDFKKLIKSINERNSTEAVPSDTVDKSVEACWAAIDAELLQSVELPKSQESKSVPIDSRKAAEKIDDILQELLVLNRAQSKILSSPENFIPKEVFELIVDKANNLPSVSHPVWRDLFSGIETIDRIFGKLELDDEELRDTIRQLTVASRYLQEKIGYSRERYARRARSNSERDLLKEERARKIRDEDA